MIAPAGSEKGADRQPDAAPWDGSRRLWSLWDMLEFNAGKFFQDIVAFSMSHINMENMRNRPADVRLMGLVNDDTARTAALTIARTLRGHCVVLNATTSIVAIDRLVAFLDNSQGKDYYHTASGYMMDVIKVLRDELMGQTFFALNAVEKSLYEDRAPFGDDVASKFASVSYDIEEAAKCLAFGRPTASAYHSIRCLEAGIRAISRCLGIPDPTKGSDRSWHNLLKAINEEINKKWPTTKDKFSGDGKYFEEVHAVLFAMQNPIRNATMHFDNKYTETEAKYIFDIVKGFMSKLASRCDEEGMPKA